LALLGKYADIDIVNETIGIRCANSIQRVLTALHFLLELLIPTVRVKAQSCRWGQAVTESCTPSNLNIVFFQNEIILLANPHTEIEIAAFTQRLTFPARFK